MMERQITPEKLAADRRRLRNTTQAKIVTDDREHTNVLVLQGQGSLVYRAYLVRIRREYPHGMLVLTYNRHSAVEARQRLGDLVGLRVA